MTTFLRFPDQATAQTVLADFYDAEYGWITASLVHALDPVGTIYTPGTFDADGSPLTPAVAQPGWCVNFIGELTAAQLAYQIEPATPQRVFAV